MKINLSTPRISVIMPCIGERDFPEISVNSVLTQGIDDLELLLVVDQDDTGNALAASQIAAIKDQRIRVLAAEGQANIDTAVHTGLAQAKGRFIAFLDAQSAYEVDALSIRLNYLLHNPEVTLVHGPTRLLNVHGIDLGVAIGRRKAMSFDAAMHPVDLSTVMGAASVLKHVPFPSVDTSPHHRGWRFFAQVLRSGVVSQYLEQGGSARRLQGAIDLPQEQASYDGAMRHIIDWLYADVQDPWVPLPYRMPLSRPVHIVAKRQIQFPFFIWALVSKTRSVCDYLLADRGFIAYLNSFTINSIADEVRIHCARHYQVAVHDRIPALDEKIRRKIVQNAEELDLTALAPSLYFALCLALGIEGRFGGAWRPVVGNPPLIEQKTSCDASAKLALVTTFRINDDAEALNDWASVLLENCANPWIQTIHVLLEGNKNYLKKGISAAWLGAMEEYITRGRLVFKAISQRPSYKQIFCYANNIGHEIVAVANADIVIPFYAAQEIIRHRAEKKNPVYVLSRWNRTPDGNFLQGIQPSPPWPKWTVQERSYLERDCWSYDTYVFNPPLDVPDALESIYVGTAGCDLAIAASLRLAGMSVQNPCLTIKTIHHDNKPLRDYLADGRGFRDEMHCLENFHADLMRRLSIDDPGRRGLENINMLSLHTAWLGGPGHAHVRETIFFILKHVLWERIDKNHCLTWLTIHIEKGDLNSAKHIILKHQQDIVDRKVFIVWKLSGFLQSCHVVDLMVSHEELEHIGYVLFRYPWQTMVHSDFATPEAQATLESISSLVRKYLYKEI